VGYRPEVWLNPFLGLYYPNQGEKVNRSDACKNLTVKNLILFNHQHRTHEGKKTLYSKGRYYKVRGGKKAQSQAHPRAEYLMLKMKEMQFLPSAPIPSDKPFAMINLYADAYIPILI
jgi:hypothetical protein